MATAYRYIREALDLLAATAPTLDRATYHAARLLYVILDGTLIPIDRVADQRPYYSGKAQTPRGQRPGTRPSRGRLLWASAALPGAVHEVRPPAATASRPRWPGSVSPAYADAAYRAPGPPSRCRSAAAPTTVGHPEAVNRSPRPQPGTRRTRHGHPQTWKILTKLRCCPHRATTIIAAIRVLQTIEDQHKRSWKRLIAPGCSYRPASDGRWNSAGFGTETLRQFK